MLEFRVDFFWKMVYNIQTSEKKHEHHTRAAKIYSLDARKCDSCGNYRFLRILSEDVLKEFKKNDMKNMLQSPRVSITRRRTVVEGKWAVSKPNFLSAKTINVAKKENSTFHRVSIMPTNFDNEDDEVPRYEENETIHQSSRFRRRSASISPETEDFFRPCYLEKFSHIDYRNCQCDNIISQLFWILQQHIENSGETGKALKFFIEYSAGVIQIAQPLYALKLLTIAAEKSIILEANEVIDENAKDNVTNRGIILALMGDAHIALGNYDRAKKYYLSAVKLRGAQPRLEKGIYSYVVQMFCKVQESPLHMADEESRRLIVERYELGSYLRRLCVVFMLNNKLKAAQSYALRGFKLVFLNANSFQEKGEIYLATLRVFYCMRNVKLIRRIEKSMITVMETKTSWNDSEEIVMVANIYLTLYQNRVLKGELEEAIDMGIKVLKISEVLHLNELMLTIMPSLVQIMLWTKRVSEAVDLMQELYFLADEDVDLSAKTWYYALSLDLMLDAGIVLESYDTSYSYYKKIIAKKSKFSICRDPQSLCHLLTNLRIYQLRMRHTVNNFPYNTEKYTKDIAWYKFSQLLTCSKEFECYLLMLLHCLNIKRSNELQILRQNIFNNIKCLKNVSKHAKVIKPRFYLLMAYLNVLRGCKSSVRFYLNKAQKCAISQGNQLTMAWIIQNRKMWREKIYDSISQRWLEHIESKDVLAWQCISNFNADTWSTILYPLPTPDAHL